MKKIALVVVVIAVAFMFAGLADAATSSPKCGKPTCKTCAKPAFRLPKLLPGSCGSCARPCAKPCAKPCVTCQPMRAEFKRDVLGNKVPTWTYNRDGGAKTDKATQYEETLISGQ